MLSSRLKSNNSNKSAVNISMLSSRLKSNNSNMLKIKK